MVKQKYLDKEETLIEAVDEEQTLTGKRRE